MYKLHSFCLHIRHHNKFNKIYQLEECTNYHYKAILNVERHIIEKVVRLGLFEMLHKVIDLKITK